MRKFGFIFSLLLILTIALCSCGEDPKIAEFRNKLTANDWQLTFLGTPMMTLRYNSDGTGLTSSVGTSGTEPFNYEIQEVSEDGNSAIIVNTSADSEETANSTGSQTSGSTMTVTLVPGGLQISSPEMPKEAQGMTFSPIEKE